MTVITSRRVQSRRKLERIERVEKELRTRCNGEWSPEIQEEIDYYQTRLYSLKRLGKLSTITATLVMKSIKETLMDQGIHVRQIRYGKLNKMDDNTPRINQKKLRPKAFKFGDIRVAYNSVGDRYVFDDIEKVKRW